MKKAKNKKINKITLIAVSLVWFISLASIGTYTWISRNWTPKVEYSDITIATAGALVIAIDDQVRDEVNLNEYSGLDTFTLKQVSSCNGKTFVGADFNPVISGKPPVYTDDVNGKYIEVDFYLKVQPYTSDEITHKKKVFLHPETEISYLANSDEEVDVEKAKKVEKAIRFSIEARGFNNNKPYIFGKNRENEDSEDLVYQQLEAANTDKYSDIIGENIYSKFDANNVAECILNEETLAPQLVYDYSYFNGEKNELNNEKLLFTIEEEKSQPITLRIWLEGCDENCVSDISGEQLKVVVKFDSVDVTFDEEN